MPFLLIAVGRTPTPTHTAPHPCRRLPTALLALPSWSIWAQQDGAGRSGSLPCGARNVSLPRAALLLVLVQCSGVLAYVVDWEQRHRIPWIDHVSRSTTPFPPDTSSCFSLRLLQKLLAPDWHATQHGFATNPVLNFTHLCI